MNDANESTAAKGPGIEAELCTMWVLVAMELASGPSCEWLCVCARACALAHVRGKWSRNRNEKFRTIAQLAVLTITGM